MKESHSLLSGKKNGLRLTGTGAYDFIHQLPGGWDLIIMDPPYHDPDDEMATEALNKRSGKFVSKIDSNRIEAFHETTIHRFMPRWERERILALIRTKAKPKAHFVYFHTDLHQLPYDWILGEKEGVACTHGWTKPGKMGVLSGSACPKNIEWIQIVPKIKGRPKGRIMDQFIDMQPPSRTKTLGREIIIARACAKPFELYLEIFRHTRAKYILDPFAGYGMSIKAADHLGLKIDACDIDGTVNWNFEAQKNLQGFETYPVGNGDTNNQQSRIELEESMRGSPNSSKGG